MVKIQSYFKREQFPGEINDGTIVTLPAQCMTLRELVTRTIQGQKETSVYHLDSNGTYPSSDASFDDINEMDEPGFDYFDAHALKQTEREAVALLKSEKKRLDSEKAAKDKADLDAYRLLHPDDASA